MVLQVLFSKATHFYTKINSMDATEKRHYAVIDKLNRKLTVLYKGEKIAETTHALILKEVGKSVYDPVYYIPKEDITLDLEVYQDRVGYCPIKGKATNWMIPNQPPTTYFAWSYEDPLPRSKKIKGHIAFNKNLVTFISAPLDKTL